MAWCFEDERKDFADSILEKLQIKGNSSNIYGLLRSPMFYLTVKRKKG